LACFFIRRDLRGQGLTKQIIEAAVQHAEKRGATVIEAYPVDPSSPSYRFMGYVQTFVSAGFYEVGRAGTRRHVLRRELRKQLGPLVAHTRRVAMSAIRSLSGVKLT